MNSGYGAELSAQHPTLAADIGRWLKDEGHDCGVYGIRCETKLGLYQSTVVPRDGTNLGCTSFASKKLRELALANPDKLYALECPTHSVTWFAIKPHMEMLPDNVHVWNRPA